MDDWLMSMLGDLTDKAAKARKVPLKVLDAPYVKDVGYFRSRLAGTNAKGDFNLNFHLQFISGIGAKFTIELHQGKDLTRLSEVRAGYTEVAAKKFTPKVSEALKHLEFDKP